MKIISKTILLSSAFSLVLPQASFASLSSAYASLVDTSPNQAVESRPSFSLKLAAVHFITNDNYLNFGQQEFLPGDLCKQSGYIYKGCPAGYVKGEACDYDSSYVKECIAPDIWCKNNGYQVTNCQIPQYPQGTCPYSSGYYKSCEIDNIRACKALGYNLTCEMGKVIDSNQSCPYNDNYKKCVCNPCSGYAYTASEASAPGYTPGNSCNSCGTIRYKRSANRCDGFRECTDGGAAGAEVCYSGNLKKFSECKQTCETCPYTDNGGNPPFDSYQYVYTGTTNCGQSCYGWCVTTGTKRYSTGCSCISNGNGGYSMHVGEYTEYYTNDIYEKTKDTSYTYSFYDTSSACERDIEEYSNYGHMCSGSPLGGSSHRSCW